MSVSHLEYSVLIVGGGPTGLMLAAELALAGIDVAILERRPNLALDGSRAGGLHARTLEVLDQRGVVERFIHEGKKHPSIGYAGFQLDISDFPTRHNYLLGLWQSRFESILAEWVTELGVPILRNREVASFTQLDSEVHVQISTGQNIRTEYLIGCDGGHSLVRKHSGIDFIGTEPSTSWIIAEVEMEEQPEYGIRHDPAGTQALGPASDGKSVRAVLIERGTTHTKTPDLSMLRDLLRNVYKTDFGLRRANWISRFTDRTRQAVSYRNGRVLLAGDAAHIHGPMGGQGLNTGVQDAVNLGWKLARVIKKISPENLLNTYHSERHPVAARVICNTLAQVALSRGDASHLALRDTMTDIFSMDEPRKRIAGMISGLDIHYPMGEGHPLIGRRMPDLVIHAEPGKISVYSLLHTAKPIFLNLKESSDFDIPQSETRILQVNAGYTGPWELPVLGKIDAPESILIRPDGYIAWAGDIKHLDLTRVLSSQFGLGKPH